MALQAPAGVPLMHTLCSQGMYRVVTMQCGRQVVTQAALLGTAATHERQRRA